MQVAKNSVVTLKYTVKDPDGNLIDAGNAPLVYLHGGYGGIFDRIEEAIHGKSAGDNVEIKLQPEDAFGEYDASLVIVEPRNLFPDNIEMGTQFERGDEDDRLYTITDIADDKVVVDGNHPLAGIALVFSCVISDVRPGTAEEISHGHVHGAHGHHH
jgi:FKBP-type peptidyl-prolyl cis-trans isomerase SlyD